jgi:hypothetical protein
MGDYFTDTGRWPEKPPPAIPTFYNGTQFRSRLEARWAAFFDAVGWSWEYEPIDLRGYIPDFVVKFKPANLLVEVKPALCLSAMEPAADKIDRSGWQEEAMVVGARCDDQCTCLLGSPSHGPEEIVRYWGPGRFFWCPSCQRVSVMSEDLSWACRQCGFNDGNPLYGNWDPVIVWREAGNLVQWRPSR